MAERSSPDFGSGLSARRALPGWTGGDARLYVDRGAARGQCSSLKILSMPSHFSPDLASGNACWNFHMSFSHSCTLGF